MGFYNLIETGIMKNIFNNLIEKGNIKKSSIIGCSDQDIFEIEKHFQCELPMIYVDFLRIAGKKAGKVFCGTDIFFPRLLDLQLEAESLLVELGMEEVLPANGKVFYMHQGYEINYFIPSTDDPPVFQFVEGNNSATIAWASFSNFIETSIKDHLQHWSDLS